MFIITNLFNIFNVFINVSKVTHAKMEHCKWNVLLGEKVRINGVGGYIEQNHSIQSTVLFQHVTNIFSITKEEDFLNHARDFGNKIKYVGLQNSYKHNLDLGYYK